MSQEEIEQRLAALEAEVARLKDRLERVALEKSWERIVGSMKDLPAFAEAVRLGAELRQAQRPEAEP